MQENEQQQAQQTNAEAQAPAVEEEDFLAGSAPACNLGEACESCQ